MAFYPRMINGQRASQPLGKIVCIGRNYAAHAAELNNAVPTKPMLFIKPSTSACDLDDTLKLRFDLGGLHYETELAVMITSRLVQASEDEVPAAIGAMGLALDLTLRDTQSELKGKGHPWEIAKGFDNACPLGPFTPVDGTRVDWSAQHFSLEIDGQPRQNGDTSNMLFTIPQMISTMSRYFTLEPGDIVLTGTPEGVGQLQAGQHLKLTLNDKVQCETVVA